MLFASCLGMTSGSIHFETATCSIGSHRTPQMFWTFEHPNGFHPQRQKRYNIYITTTGIEAQKKQFFQKECRKQGLGSVDQRHWNLIVMPQPSSFPCCCLLFGWGLAAPRPFYPAPSILPSPCFVCSPHPIHWLSSNMFHSHQVSDFTSPSSGRQRPGGASWDRRGGDCVGGQSVSHTGLPKLDQVGYQRAARSGE